MWLQKVYTRFREVSESPENCLGMSEHPFLRIPGKNFNEAINHRVSTAFRWSVPMIIGLGWINLTPINRIGLVKSSACCKGNFLPKLSRAQLTIIFICIEDKRAWRSHGRIVRHWLRKWSAWILHSNFRRGKKDTGSGEWGDSDFCRLKLATLGFN